ncbi:MAG: hypothetical protein CSA15_03245 [Candidatus Delongbacteria bacterium]|nr:MAG: hypothetical protein CSA15_03245 [Candidatus Delongbacteria bacterium]
MYFSINKDIKPEETISKIRNILLKLNIFVIEKKWNQVGLYSHSVILEIENYNGISVNGKGISKKYALASAYGELMERLQNLRLIKKKYGLTNEIKLSYHDTISIEKNKFIKENIEYLKLLSNDEYVEKLLKNKRKKEIDVVPFYNLFNDKISYLPLNLLFYSCTTNGMCAGNTPYEALSQGICEIFERYIRKIVFMSDKSFPDIPISFLENLTIFKIIKNLLSLRRYKIIIKDLSLGGKFPVVGLIVIDTTLNKYRFSVGSDVILDVALQRCFTEIFQGLDLSVVHKVMSDISFTDERFNKILSYESEKKRDIEFFKDFTKGFGKIPNKLYLNTHDFHKRNIERAFLKGYKSNKDSLLFLKEIIKKNNLDLLIRDNSFLNFPTFQIYIPSLSEIWNTEFRKKHNYSIIGNEYNDLLKLKNINNESLERLLHNIEKRIEDPKLIDILSKKVIEIIPYAPVLTSKSDICNLSVNFLLVMICIKLGNYKKAYKYLDLYLSKFKTNSEESIYYKCVLFYLKLKSQGVNDNLIKVELENIFDISYVKNVLNDLSNPNEVLKYYKLPNCGNCNSCEALNECKYSIWYELALKLKSSLLESSLSQKDIRNYFM